MAIANPVITVFADRQKMRATANKVTAATFERQSLSIVGNGYCDGLSTAGDLLHFVRDRKIYGEGDNADLFFKVVSGVVRTCKFLSNGRRYVDAFHVSGDVFGLEVGTEHHLSAAAVSACTVKSYRRCGLEMLAANNVELSLQLFSLTMRNLAQAQQHSLSLGRRSAIEKVAAFLIEWAEHLPNSKIITLAMTREDIADYLGLTIETVSRTLSQLESEAFIDLPSARRIRLKDSSGLRHLSS